MTNAAVAKASREKARRERLNEWYGGSIAVGLLCTRSLSCDNGGGQGPRLATRSAWWPSHTALPGLPLQF